MFEEEEEEQLCGSYDMFKSVADVLYKKGDYRKAIDSYNMVMLIIELSMVFTRIIVQLGCYITVINQCYSLLTRIAITRRFASPLALLMAGDSSEGVVPPQTSIQEPRAEELHWLIYIHVEQKPGGRA